MSKKFVNAIVPVFHSAHVQAVLNEAERLGYKPHADCSTLAEPDEFHRVQSVHLGSCGTVYAFIHYNAQELLESHHERYNTAIVLNKLRKLRDLDFKLNHPSVESQDNLAVLAVIPRPKYAVVAPVTPVEYLRGAGVPSDLICAPYGSNEFPECPCLGVDANARKTCRMVKAYGGTCGKPFVKLLKANQEDKDKVIEWVRPKAENPIVTTVVRWLAVQGERVARVLKAGFNFLRGNK